MLRDHITETYYGIILQDYIMESNYRIALWNHVTILYNGIMLRNHAYEEDPGDPWGVPIVPWDLRRPPRHSPGTPPGTPLGPPRDLRGPTNTAT